MSQDNAPRERQGFIIKAEYAKRHATCTIAGWSLEAIC